MIVSSQAVAGSYLVDAAYAAEEAMAVFLPLRARKLSRIEGKRLGIGQRSA
jgi:hypothetical protein